MKSGWRTSEFWLVLSKQVVGLAALLGVVNVVDAEKLSSAIAIVVAIIFQIVSDAYVTRGFINDRTELKKEVVKEEGSKEVKE